jgi:pimeloyl-ACP methyl ester carboxylesterase
MSSGTVMEVGQQKTRVLQEGTGPEVVVLHGWGGRIESMAPVIGCLSEDFRVTAIDLPGFGESPTPRGVWGAPDYAAYVRDLLGELGIERAFFVGHSFGGMTSLYLAAVHGELVEKLALISPSGVRTPPSARARARKAVGRAGRAAGKLGPPGRRVKAAVYDRLGSDDYKQAGPMQPILVRVVNEDVSPLLSRVKASTLVVWGENDEAVPLAGMQKMEQLMPDAAVVVFENAGHFAYLDDQARFCRIVRHFFGAPGR